MKLVLGLLLSDFRDSFPRVNIPAEWVYWAKYITHRTIRFRFVLEGEENCDFVVCVTNVTLNDCTETTVVGIPFSLLFFAQSTTQHQGDESRP